MFRRYKPFFRAGAMDCLAYKGAMFGWLVVSALEIICIFFLWIGVYKSSPNGVDSVINGFTFKEMLVYITFVNIFNFVSFHGDTMYYISDEIKTGTIAMSFVKPISYRKRFAFTNLGNVFMRELILGLPCFVLAYVLFVALGYLVITSWWIFLIYIALFLVAQLFAVLLCDCIDYICGVLCFYTTAAWGMNQMKNVLLSFLSGSLIPITFFPEVFQKVLNWSPFIGLSQNPVFILMMKMDLLSALRSVALSLIWLIVMELLAMGLFRVASKKVTVQGG